VKNSLLKNGFYNILAGAIRIGLFVLTIPILIRLMGIEAYGVWTLAYSVLGMVTLAEAGLSVATTVFVSQDLRKEETDSLSKTLTITFGAILILSTFALFAIYFSAQPIVSLFPKIDQAQQLILMQALQIGGIVVWVQLIQRALVGVEQPIRVMA
jgi:O-antigen/teichoic acid export membrane protein